MKIDVKVYGEIENVSQSEYAILVKGNVDTVSLSSRYCGHESVLFFEEGYEGVVIEGIDLKLMGQKKDEVKVRGNIIALKFLNEDGEVVKRFNVEVCCIKLTEVPEEEEVDDSILE